MVAYCKERGHRVMITSNGLFTKPSMVNDILKFRAWIQSPSPLTASNGNETVVEGHTSNKVYENIEAVVKGRKLGEYGGQATGYFTHGL